MKQIPMMSFMLPVPIPLPVPFFNWAPSTMMFLLNKVKQSQHFWSTYLMGQYTQFSKYAHLFTSVRLIYIHRLSILLIFLLFLKIIFECTSSWF
jgi:hypothetical protein